MHYFPSTYNEVCDCVLKQQHRATVAGRKALRLVIGRFQQQAIIEEISKWPVYYTPQISHGPPQFMGLPFEVVGEFECKVMTA